MHRSKLQNALHNPIPAGQNQSKNFVSFTNLSPQTSAEHYWASRALKAEALLSAREKHFEEVGKDELQSLEARYKEKYNNLERLLVVLALVMALLLVLLTYVVASHNNAGLSNATNTPGFPFLSFLWSRSGISNLSKQEFIPNRFNLHLHLPSHFTIPILSPWSSVVSTPQSFHHEVSCPHRLYLLFPPFLYRWKIRPQAPSVLQPPPVSTPFS
ncbi:hypothetical protein AGABI1DRAFT_131007 [Agaricus bisporus var. burnettii JB137-S8]|uniref:Uncharacterized protein n=1 Tax=Agaricus bisporus var. burnettii (strain JB137-S8 / ATCC MYA-4627 / FGSC 10392) TaxID=597362 RepID=K5X1D9_AGABU|nr:uncharacterized protein AGABI1DRAFT_131007 [Agaricus bisporus var. burnettii JB137-S8]EKM76712.1 hypothetical protein AGABI1DRAFT_131007 [Agaricus bisporus var. burnettii JB137-S8]